MTVDLIIPMLNEAENVEALFDALAPLIETGRVRHVVVGDNGSSDDTPSRVEARGGIVVLEPQRGYGAACLKAIDWVRSEASVPPDAIAFIDADLSDHPSDLLTLLEAMETHDLVIGCRTRLADPGSLNPVQRFGNLVATTMIWLATGARFRDLGPMRVVRWNAYEQMGMQDRTWGWTVEMQTKAAMMNLRVGQIDVPYHCRVAGQSKISGNIVGAIKAGWKITTTIWTVRLMWKRSSA